MELGILGYFALFLIGFGGLGILGYAFYFFATEIVKSYREGGKEFAILGALMFSVLWGVILFLGVFFWTIFSPRG